MTIYEDLKSQLHTKGVDIIDTNYYDLIDVWKSWYTGSVENFHFYNVKYADGSEGQVEKKTMSMAKKGAEDMMKLNWSNKCDIKLATDEKTKKLWKILDSKQNNFTIMFPQMLELSFALGTTAMTEYKDELGRTRIEYINDASMIIPYAYDNFNITGFIVLDQFQEVEKKTTFYYTHLTYHEFRTSKNEKDEFVQEYIKLHELYKSKAANQLGKQIPFEDKFPNVEEEVTYNTDTPHFQIIKPPIANNIDIKTPMGLSIYANSIDKLKAIDDKYDSFDNEFIDGKRRILVDKTALKSTPQVNDDAFRTKEVYATVIKDVIIDLVKSVCYLEDIELSEDEIQVEFDYSRFENQTATQQRLEREVDKGITSKVEYRMKVYNETEEVAREKIETIKKESPSINDLVGGEE